MWAMAKADKTICGGKKMVKTISVQQFATKAFGAALMTAAVLSASSASAALLAESSLVTTNTVLFGVNDGTGFSEAWHRQNAANDFALNPTSLTFGPLVTAGKSVAGGNAFSSHGRRLSTAAAGNPFSTAGLVSDRFTPQLVDRGTVWFSALARPTATLGTDTVRIAFTNVGGGNDAVISAGDIVIRGQGGANQFWGVSTNGGNNSAVSTSTPVAANSTVLLIGKFSLGTGGSNGEFRLWAFNNPNQVTLGGADLADGTAMATLTGQTVESVVGNTGMSFRTLIIRPGTGAGQAELDEFRFGTTFADVTPIPEPTSLAAIGLGAAGLLKRRRNGAI